MNGRHLEIRKSMAGQGYKMTMNNIMQLLIMLGVKQVYLKR